MHQTTGGIINIAQRCTGSTSSGSRSRQFVSVRQYMDDDNGADGFSADVVCGGARVRLLS